ncbi:MAG TPA: DUF4199 domain-containing protein [Candidatus Eisenbacteria bacterium]|nr:DUF4199 domain-containing protein [Candidatus Eisenbacteria bacterium]
MGTIPKHGIVLGIVVEIWTAIVIAAGWHKDPLLLYLFFLVLPIQATILILAIREVSAAGAGYGRKVLTGLGVSLLGGAIILLGSVLLTTVVFPHYFDELRVAGEALLVKAGKTPEEVAAMMKANESMYSPWSSGIQGFVGTMATGVLVSLIAAGWIRKR